MINAEEGRKLWNQLHSVGDNEEKQRAFFPPWFLAVKMILQCPSCVRKLERFVRFWPVEYGEEFYLWGICLHDYVNKELGRKLFYPDLTLAPLINRGIIQ